jgi:hypothetical protein
MVFTDAGRSLGLTATLRSGEKIHLLNVYQFTAAHHTLQSQLWERLKGWIRKHLAEKIVLLGDLNSTMPEALVSREIVWQDIGRHRPRGGTEYSNEGLRTLLLPRSLVWKVTQGSRMRHAPIPLSSTLTDVIECKYGHRSPWRSQFGARHPRSTAENAAAGRGNPGVHSPGVCGMCPQPPLAAAAAHRPAQALATCSPAKRPAPKIGDDNNGPAPKFVQTAIVNFTLNSLSTGRRLKGEEGGEI